MARAGTDSEQTATASADRRSALPPGQRRVDGFPRFGVLLDRPPPAVPAAAAIEIRGLVDRPFEVPLTELRDLPRREITADFHCVAGWTATGLRWAGIPFETFYRRMVEPAVAPGVSVSHLRFGGLDGYRVAMRLEDAMAADVLIADHLDGRPLGADHGAPARLVAPAHYGFLNVKHLCLVEVHASEPRDLYGGHPLARLFLSVFQRHPRARVWREERHRYLPAWAVRPVGRALIGPIAGMGARGARRR